MSSFSDLFLMYLWTSSLSLVLTVGDSSSEERYMRVCAPDQSVVFGTVLGDRRTFARSRLDCATEGRNSSNVFSWNALTKACVLSQRNASALCDSLTAEVGALLYGLQDNPKPTLYVTPEPGEWTEISSSQGLHIYTPVLTQVTWQVAKDNCTSMGGYLAIIDSQPEELALETALLNNPALMPLSEEWCIFIGSTDSVAEGLWRWVDGTTLLNTDPNWKADSPGDPDTSKNCLCYKKDLSPTTRWEFDDHQCNHSHVYLCEKDD